MHKIRVLLGFACIPILSGCMMMGGMGSTTGMGGVGDAGVVHSGQIHTPLRQTKASNGVLTIALSFPAPSDGAAVPINARLHTESDHNELTDAYVGLRIRTPRGSIDEIRMHPLDSSTAETHQAQYSFRDAGVYVVTAEARVGRGDDARTVSASIETEVAREAHSGQGNWLTPAALVGGLSMVVIMVLTMGGGT